MEINQNTMNLICKLEYKIGEMCSNSNTYNGWTGEYGADFRYPVTVEGVTRCRYNLEVLDLAPEKLKDIYYKFGSNRLYIGYSIKHLLEELETLYGLDFAKLEEERKNSAQ